ncbi:MAG TPA: alpha/beta hydrolase, partial [Solirubrobacteraceae bacterium]|nr:alpha/beta hydrolase [Solirubrobacteraceae bacterium]
KRAMAADCVALAGALGHQRFAVVGHDRGAYVAFRAALDQPDAISALAILDAIPIGDALARTDAAFAQAWWHWFFLGQTDKPAERVISADPDAWYRPDRELMGEENHADYRRAIHDPQTVHAMCEDYRAGLGIDRAHDEADRRKGRQIACPTLVAWAAHDDMEELYGDPLAPWRAWSQKLRGTRIDSGHHMAEEAPGELARELLVFLA